MTPDSRLEALTRWVGDALPGRGELTPASVDASFRRYFRVQTDDGTCIAVDAPPEREDCGRYVRVARAFRALGLHVPEILAADLTQGFLLVTDLGRRPYLDALNEETVERLYGDALGALIVLQAGSRVEPGLLPPYDAALLERELAIFPEWYVGRHLGRELTTAQRSGLSRVFDRLVASALEQPRVWVHRDYHSRNLMVTASNNPGILDFQDAVEGPVTYDVVSLLRDCYIAWPRERVEDWAKGYYELGVQSGVPVGESEERFLEWFDLMGVQRHLKAAGIFARLLHRDGKPGYLADVPRTLGYVREVSARYPALRPLAVLLGELAGPP